MFSVTFIIAIFYCTILDTNFGNGANILFLPTPILDSHRRSMFPIAEALGKRGHYVKIFMENVNAYIKPVSDREKPYVDTELYFIEDQWHWITNFKAYVNKKNWQRRWTMAPSHLISVFVGAYTTHNLMEKAPAKIKELLRTQWDLIVVDAFMSSTGILLSSLTNTTLATYNLAVLSTVESYKKSTPYSMAYVPTLFLDDMDYDHRSFWHRVLSVWNDLLGFVLFFVVDHVLFWWYLSQYNPKVSLDALHERVAFSLVDFSPSFEYAKPYGLNTVYYGGYCPTVDWALATPMQPEVESFINDPRSKGTIVIAFGQIMGWKHAPNHTQTSFLDALNKLDQYRIVCQFNGHVPNFGFKEHILVLKWIPQQALLNHPSTKLFITHGGIKSITETICAQVPTLIIPFFYDQVRNGHLLIKSGAGLAQDQLTTESILENVQKILTNDSFKVQTKKLHKFFNNKPISPLDFGAFWAEFFIRHKNLPNFWYKTGQKNLTWLQSNYIDWAIVVLICILSTILLVTCFFKYRHVIGSVIKRHLYDYAIVVPYRVLSFLWFQILINLAVAIKRKFYT